VTTGQLDRDAQRRVHELLEAQDVDPVSAVHERVEHGGNVRQDRVEPGAVGGREAVASALAGPGGPGQRDAVDLATRRR
jgi:hypothetical protein